MATEAARYRAVDFDAYAVGQNEYVLVSAAFDGPRRVDGAATYLLRMCNETRTFDEHVEGVARGLAVEDRGAVAQELRALIGAGLLARSDAVPLQSPRLVPSRNPARITRLGIVTADRPQALQRCIESYVHHSRAFGQPIRVLILDDSRRKDSRDLNRAIGVRTATRWGVPVEYVGPEKKAAIQSAAVKAGAEPALVQFGLPFLAPEPSAGGNRNFLLLLTAGEQVLSVDDDTVCSPWAHPETCEGLAVFGHRSPVDSFFFATRSEAMAAAHYTDADLIGAHNALLGQSLGYLADGAAFSEQACEHLRRGLHTGHPSYRVRLTFSGIAGDGAWYCPHRILFTSGATRARLAADRSSYQTALSSREVLRVARQAAVGHESNCMAYCMAADNSQLLPPFMPTYRNQDGVFGASVSLCDPAALFGHVAYGVVHDSARPAAYERPTILSASQVRISDLLIRAVSSCASAALSSAPASRTRRLGQHLCDLGSLDVADFVALTTRWMLEERCRELAATDTAMARQFEYPDCWKADIARYRETLLTNALNPEFFLPIEFRGAGPREEAFGRVQRFVGHFGELLRQWPEMWAAAKRGLEEDVSTPVHE